MGFRIHCHKYTSWMDDMAEVLDHFPEKMEFYPHLHWSFIHAVQEVLDMGEVFQLFIREYNDFIYVRQENSASHHWNIYASSPLEGRLIVILTEQHAKASACTYLTSEGCHIYIVPYVR